MNSHKLSGAVNLNNVSVIESFALAIEMPWNLEVVLICVMMMMGLNFEGKIVLYSKPIVHFKFRIGKKLNGVFGCKT